MRYPNHAFFPLGQLFALFGLCSLFFLPQQLFATHNLAGQITAQRVDPNNTLQYEFTLTTYTDPSNQVDRCAATFYVYDAITANVIEIIEDVPRNNGPLMQGIPNGECVVGNARNGVPVRGPVKRNIYQTEFTFPNPGEYFIMYFDPARQGDVINMSRPLDENFCVITRVFIVPALAGQSNTVQLLNEPLDNACLGEIWTHSPGAWDPDGDSLSYELTESLGFDPDEALSIGQNPFIVDGYEFPNSATFGASTLTMDPITGLITWDAPQTIGVYNLAYIVREWRNGIEIGYVLRDMAIWVENCDNNPPVVETITDTCVFAGDILMFDYLSYDPDSTDSLYLALNNGALGDNGPFAVDNRATIDGRIVNLGNGTQIPYSTLPQATNNNDNPTADPDTIKGTVIWVTECDNVRKEHYQVDFYATDNKNYENIPGRATLAAFASVAIKVRPSPPTNLQITKGNGAFSLQWDTPFCTERLIEYRIYRKTNGGGSLQDTICCEEPPTSAGYQLIDTVAFGENTFLDQLEDIEGFLGDSICYAVTAVYGSIVTPTFPETESCAADGCVEIESSPIYLTNDSIGTAYTDAVNGSVFLAWSQPIIDPLYPAPYTYTLYRANNNGFPAIPVASGLGYTDTTYLDTLVDTESRGYNYRVEIFDSRGQRIPVSENTHIGSTIYLSAEGGGNNFIDLDWTVFVPWTNQDFEIYRSTNGGAYTRIAVIPGTGATAYSYRDEELNPTVEYCYFIRSIGGYNEPGIKTPLINDSQEDCDFAQDDNPPCPPTGSASGNCSTQEHTIQIFKPEGDCADDAKYITVSFGNRPEGPFRQLFQLPYNSFATDTLIQITLNERGGDDAGCYALTATDSLGNESEILQGFCVDYCPSLVMSNVFTPNDDGTNDILFPEEYRDVRLVEFQIFDRWGRLMSTTRQDIERLWDGLNDRTLRPVPEGVYYYVLRYEELSLTENQPRELKGWVTLLR